MDNRRSRKKTKESFAPVEEDDDERVRERVREWWVIASSVSRVEWRAIAVCGGVWTSGMQGRWQVTMEIKEGKCLCMSDGAGASHDAGGNESERWGCPESGCITLLRFLFASALRPLVHGALFGVFWRLIKVPD